MNVVVRHKLSNLFYPNSQDVAMEKEQGKKKKKRGKGGRRGRGGEEEEKEGNKGRLEGLLLEQPFSTMT